MFKEIFDNSPISILIGQVCEINGVKDIILKEKNQAYRDICKKDINEKYFINDLLEVNKDMARAAINECMAKSTSEFIEYIIPIEEFCRINFKKLNDNYIVITIRNILKFERNLFGNVLENEKCVVFLQHRDGRYMYATNTFIDIVSEGFNNETSKYLVDNFVNLISNSFISICDNNNYFDQFIRNTKELKDNVDKFGGTSKIKNKLKDVFSQNFVQILCATILNNSVAQVVEQLEDEDY